MFKASDYRLSPFELESALTEHPAIMEAAVMPAPDALRQAVPKAFITLVAHVEPSSDVAQDIFRHIVAALAPYQRVKRLEFGELPKTISGKIRRSSFVILRPNALRPARDLLVNTLAAPSGDKGFVSSNGEMGWREDQRRVSNGEQFLAATGAALRHPVSRQWKGYWQR